MWFGVLLFLNKFVQIIKYQFNVFVLVCQLLFDFFNFKFDTQIIGKQLTDFCENPHNLNVYFNRSFTV